MFSLSLSLRTFTRITHTHTRARALLTYTHSLFAHSLVHSLAQSLGLNIVFLLTSSSLTPTLSSSAIHHPHTHPHTHSMETTKRWATAESVGGVSYAPFKDETELPRIMELVGRDLSEPYSIFTYRYFIQGWPMLCQLVRRALPKGGAKRERAGSHSRKKGPPTATDTAHAGPSTGFPSPHSEGAGTLLYRLPLNPYARRAVTARLSAPSSAASSCTSLAPCEATLR